MVSFEINFVDLLEKTEINDVLTGYTIECLIMKIFLAPKEKTHMISFQPNRDYLEQDLFIKMYCNEGQSSFFLFEVKSNLSH